MQIFNKKLHYCIDLNLIYHKLNAKSADKSSALALVSISRGEFWHWPQAKRMAYFNLPCQESWVLIPLWVIWYQNIWKLFSTQKKN